MKTRKQIKPIPIVVPLLAFVVAAMPVLANDGSAAAATGVPADIRPFHINIPEEALVDLRQRIAATRWLDRETVTDESQGVQFATMQKLARYWATDYDWRKCEAKLNALPQFITTIDGVDIHFIQVRSRHPNALPVIITHGWPARSSNSSRSLDRSPIRPRMAGASRTPSMW